MAGAYPPHPSRLPIVYQDRQEYVETAHDTAVQCQRQRLDQGTEQHGTPLGNREWVSKPEIAGSTPAALLASTGAIRHRGDFLVSAGSPAGYRQIRWIPARSRPREKILVPRRKGGAVKLLIVGLILWGDNRDA